MASSTGVRRSGRERKAVKTVIEEQNEEVAAPPPKHQRKNPPTKITTVKKIKIIADEPCASSEEIVRPPTPDLSSEEEVETPKKKRAKKSKQARLPGKVNEYGIRRLDTVELRPPGEKRPARFGNLVSHESDSYQTFLHRASTQRLVILGRSYDNEGACHANHDNCPYHEVKIADGAGNIYTIIISHIPSCSCPNTSLKGKDSGQALCKHILYVLHNVFKAPSHLCYQNAFLTSELKEITANTPALPIEAMQDEAMDGKRKPVEDDCPICCMDFEEGEDVVWCRAACGNSIHKECFNQWAKTKRGGVVTCPFCRTEWEAEAKKAGRSASTKDIKMPTSRVNGYYNVADQLDGFDAAGRAANELHEDGFEL